MTERHGARLNLLGDPSDRNKVVYVAQTIKGGTQHNAPYHIQRRENGKAIETFIDYEDDAALLKAIRDALNGSL